MIKTINSFHYKIEDHKLAIFLWLKRSTVFGAFEINDAWRASLSRISIIFSENSSNLNDGIKKPLTPSLINSAGPYLILKLIKVVFIAYLIMTQVKKKVI